MLEESVLRTFENVQDIKQNVNLISQYMYFQILYTINSRLSELITTETTLDIGG